MWLLSGDLAEGAEVAATAIDAPGAENVPVWRARALYGDGLLAFRAGDMDRARARNEEALRVARASGDLRGECDGLTGLARVALRDGRYENAVALAREARERARSARDAAAESAPLHLEAAGVRMLQDYAAARKLYTESLELGRREGIAGRVAMEQHNLGWVELHLGDVDAAEQRFRERDAASGVDAYGDAWSDLNWAAIAVARQNWDEARRRFERGRAGLDKLAMVLDPDDQFEFDWLRGRIEESRC